MCGYEDANRANEIRAQQKGVQQQAKIIYENEYNKIAFVKYTARACSKIVSRTFKI